MHGSPRALRRVEPIVRLITGLLLAVSMVAAVADLPADLRRLTGLAAALPPEFQADALLQIVE